MINIFNFSTFLEAKCTHPQLLQERSFFHIYLSLKLIKKAKLLWGVGLGKCHKLKPVLLKGCGQCKLVV